MKPQQKSNDSKTRRGSFTRIAEFVKIEMNSVNGHNFDHALRVFETCKKILEQVQANERIVLAAALLHDIVDHKFYSDPEAQYEKIRALLKKQKYTADEIARIEWLIGNTAFSKGVDLSGNIEAQILSDADKLDAIGAIGLVRTIQFNTARGFDFARDTDEIKYFAEMYRNNKTPQELFAAAKKLPAKPGKENPLYHIHQKYFKIPDRLYTDYAKEDAKLRTKFLVDFLAEYYREHTIY